jgi:amino acid adenylation domain-containing protein
MHRSSLSECSYQFNEKEEMNTQPKRITEELAEEPNPPSETVGYRSYPAGLPSYRRRPKGVCEKTATVHVEISGELYSKLSALTKDELFLQYAAMMAALSVCLYRYSRSSSIAIGCPTLISEDDTSKQDNVVLVVLDVNDQMTFRHLLLNVRQTLLEASNRQSYSLASLVQRDEVGVSQNCCRLFDVALETVGLHHRMPDVSHDITLTFSRQPGHLSLRAAFSPQQNDRDTIHRFCHHIVSVLSSGMQSTNKSVSELEILAEHEWQAMLEWNNTGHVYPRDKCVHECFELQVERSPNKVALVFGNQRLTYRELNERANQLARYLQRLDIKPDTPIGLCLNRSIEQVIGVLGILKAGGAYVPYDPTYPRDRLAAMLQDLKVKAIVTTKRLSERLPVHNAKVVCLDREAAAIAGASESTPPFSSGPLHLCYVIFTSGSTGRAKATAVYHRGWTNLMHWFIREFGVSPTDKTLVMSSISFDITQRAMAMPLMSGGELHLVASDYFDPGLVVRTIEQEQITLLSCAPSTFYPLVEDAQSCEYPSLRSLRCLFLGGEAISASRLKMWANSRDCKAEIANVYGAAECTDVSSFYRLHDFDRYIETSVPIGKPIYNSRVYIVDKELRPVPIGVIGEICLGGDGVGKGYITDAALTAEKFLQNPLAKEPGARLYRTGDLGRYLPDGNIEFYGRIDHQVKLRGQRIELGEIEIILRQHSKIKEAVVIDAHYAANDQRLIAYFVPRHQEFAIVGNELMEELRSMLGKKLPQSMIPNAFVMLEAMPLNPNGKIDRGALPTPCAITGSEASHAPLTPTEETLAEFFSKLLGVGTVGAHSNFFNLGGHSMLVTQMLARIAEKFAIQFPAAEFYSDPTVRSMARRIDAMITENQSSV